MIAAAFGRRGPSLRVADAPPLARFASGQVAFTLLTESCGPEPDTRGAFFGAAPVAHGIPSAAEV